MLKGVYSNYLLYNEEMKKIDVIYIIIKLQKKHRHHSLLELKI